MAFDHSVDPRPSSERRSPREGTVEPSSVSSLRTTGATLALSVETDRIRGYLLEYISSVYRLVAWSSMSRYAEKDIPAQVSALCHHIGAQINRNLWDKQADSPLLQSTDNVRYPPIDYVAIAASPLPLLRTWIIALSSSHSMAATGQASTAAPSQIVGRTVLDAEIDIHTLTRALIGARPDVLVVAGGYDTANPVAQQPMRVLTSIVIEIMRSLPTHMRPALIFAGNQWVGIDIEQQLHDLEDTAAQVVPNVMPAAGIFRQDALAHALDNRYLDSCSELSGFEHLSQWITGPARIASVESFFARLIHVWMDANDLPELHGLYCARDRWVHVWTDAGVNEVQFLYTQPGQYPATLQEWPQVDLLSGAWATGYGPRPQVTWWDRAGMAPAIAAIGQFSPAAMLHVMEADVLMPMRRSPS